MDPEKVAAVSKKKSSRTIKELRASLGIVGCYRRFIQVFGKNSRAALKAIKQKRTDFLGAKSVNL